MRLRVVLLVWGLSAVPAAAVSPDPRDLVIPPQELSRARDLVRQLSSDTFRDRERAQRELAAMGRLARPVLADAAQADPDPEVRFRCARLLPRAAADDLRARTEAFLADAEGKFDHDLPGWKKFRTAVGADGPARALFVEILKSGANGELLAAVDRPVEEAGRAIADRRNLMFAQIQQRQIRPLDGSVPASSLTLPDVATLLFAESVVPGKDVPRIGQFGFFVSGANFLQQPAAKAAIDTTGTPHADAYRKILARWLDTRTAPDELSNFTLLSAAHQLRAVEGTTPLLRRAVRTEGVQGFAKAYAMTYLVQRNGTDELPLLKSRLDDTTGVGVGNNNGVTLQVRDVALALSAHLTGQDVKSYGFDFPNGNNPAVVTNYPSGYGFSSDEKRDAAHRKWREWEATPRKDEKR